MHAVAGEHLQVLLRQTRPREGARLVVVVQIEARRIPVVGVVDERDRRVEVLRPDGGHVGHRMEQGVRRGGRLAVPFGGSHLLGEVLPVLVGEPAQRGDVNLIGGRRRRGVQEAAPAVVEDILAVVGAVAN